MLPRNRYHVIEAKDGRPGNARQVRDGAATLTLGPGGRIRIALPFGLAAVHRRSINNGGLHHVSLRREDPRPEQSAEDIAAALATAIVEREAPS